MYFVCLMYILFCLCSHIYHDIYSDELWRHFTPNKKLATKLVCLECHFFLLLLFMFYIRTRILRTRPWSRRLHFGTRRKKNQQIITWTVCVNWHQLMSFANSILGSTHSSRTNKNTTTHLTRKVICNKSTLDTRPCPLSAVPLRR